MSNKPSHLSNHIHPAFNGFRRENLLSCFGALCESTSLTRAELATETDLSIMTTGKIADAMIESGILIEEKLPTAGAGRRPGTLRFCKKPLFLILNLSSRRFSAHILSPNMQAKEICVYDYNDIFPYDDNLLIFLNAVRRAYNTEQSAVPYLAIITSPEDDKRQCITNSLLVSPRSPEHLLHMISKILKRECDLVMDEILASQTYFNSHSVYKNVDCGVYISISDMMYASVWMRGNLLSPRVCRIGDLLLPEHQKIAKALANALCTEDAIIPTAYAISTLESFFTPDLVVLESNRFRMDEVFLQEVYAGLKPILPVNSRVIPISLSSATPSTAICGCAAELRRKWFYELTELRF